MCVTDGRTDRQTDRRSQHLVHINSGLDLCYTADCHRPTLGLLWQNDGEVVQLGREAVQVRHRVNLFSCCRWLVDSCVHRGSLWCPRARLNCPILQTQHPPFQRDTTDTVSTGFQYVSESPSRPLCSCGSVSMVLSARTLCPTRRRPVALTAASTRCIQLPRMRTSTVQRSFAFHVQFGTVCRQLCETAFCLWERSRVGESSVMDNSEHHPALLGRFVITAPSTGRAKKVTP